MNKKTLLITGSTGFIGKNLCGFFNNKYKVLAPTHKELDFLDEKKVEIFFKKNNVGFVIHTAVVGGSRHEEYVADALLQNFRMFFNIVKSKKYFKRLIHFGSGAEYDKTRPLVKIKENQFDQKIPKDEYGFSKYLCSKYLERLDLDFVNLRIFGLFGPHEDYRLRFISNAICRNLHGLPITMRQNVYFDYVYIDDFIKIVDHFINNKTMKKFFNIGTGRKIDLTTIARKINLLAKNKSKIVIKYKGLNNEYTCDNTRLKTELKNFRFEDFDKSLAKLYNWYQNNLKNIDPKSL